MERRMEREAARPGWFLSFADERNAKQQYKLAKVIDR